MIRSNVQATNGTKECIMEKVAIDSYGQSHSGICSNGMIFQERIMENS